MGHSGMLDAGKEKEGGMSGGNKEVQKSNWVLSSIFFFAQYGEDPFSASQKVRGKKDISQASLCDKY